MKNKLTTAHVLLLATCCLSTISYGQDADQLRVKIGELNDLMMHQIVPGLTESLNMTAYVGEIRYSDAEKIMEEYESTYRQCSTSYLLNEVGQSNYQDMTLAIDYIFSDSSEPASSDIAPYVQVAFSSINYCGNKATEGMETALIRAKYN